MALLSNFAQPFSEFLFERSHLEGVSKRKSPVVSLRVPPNGITGDFRRDPACGMAFRMFPQMRLNRRHKVILFLTLLAAGMSLISSFGLHRTAGIVLLGVASAWVFGSSNSETGLRLRAIHGFVSVQSATAPSAS